MVTFLSGGTGTPKLLTGTAEVFPPDDITVVANTGDDVEIGGSLVCPDVDTLLYLGADLLDTETWWGIDDDTARTHEEIQRLSRDAGYSGRPRYLDESKQSAGRPISNGRRFSGVGEFMHIGDRDRAIHIVRTGLIDEGNTLTEAIQALAGAMEVPWTVLPMSDDPVSTILETPEGPMHFQEFWVGNDGEPAVDDVSYAGANEAAGSDAVLSALQDRVVVGPANPVTSIGPMLAIDEIRNALENAPVVVVSPFVEDQVFSGPAAKLLAATGYEPSTAGVADAYPFADAFVLDDADRTALDCPVVRTDTEITDADAATGVAKAVADALELIS